VSWGGALEDFWMNKEWTLVIRDVTESKRLHQQIIRSEKLSAVGQLISGIAHELNNPLQAVVGYADLLTEEMRESSERKGKVDAASLLGDLKIITDNAMRCQKIIENLLLFVRQGEIKKKSISIGRVAQAAVDLLHYKLKKAANIDVSIDAPSSLPEAWGNFQQLQQVLVNLVNNATDAMSGQAGVKTIAISARKDGDMVRVEVVDSGPGIPESVRMRLFEPFFTTKGEGRGTGLGLAVCRQIVEDHGGRMGFRTQVGVGTTFYIDLPAARAEDKEDGVKPPAPPPVKGKTILVVDDEPDVLSFLSKVLEGEGDQVEKASSFRDATVLAAGTKFDLVIADIRLGEGTGLGLFEGWSLWTRSPRPPFLFITGDVVNSILSQEVEGKGLQILHKPIDVSSFQVAVRSLLLLPR
jgi:two-component system NtrC family sensor kinase